MICCKRDIEARMLADAVATQIYEKNPIGVLTNDERTFNAVMMDMMMRGMAARGINMDDIPVIDIDMDGKALS